VLRSKYLRARENDQVLLAHPPPGTGVPLTIFFKEGGSKIGLKFSKCTSITLPVVRVAPWYFATWRASRLGC